MKRWMLTGLVWAAGAGLLAAQEAQFSKAVTHDAFASAGLEKLSPEELARLDQLVEAYRSGAIEAARKEAAAAAAARVAAEAKATQAETELRSAKAETAKAKEGVVSGLLAKAKVLLKPGTEVEYETVETRLMGDFKGWEPGTVFTLENGQRWRVINGSYDTPPERGPRKVRIIPGMVADYFAPLIFSRQTL